MTPPHLVVAHNGWSLVGTEKHLWSKEWLEHLPSVSESSIVSIAHIFLDYENNDRNDSEK